MKRFLILLSSASLMLGACTDNAVLTDEQGTLATQPLLLTDAAGNAISTADSECGTYYAHIHSQGEWTLTSNAAYIVPLTESGQGDAVVEVIVGNNWQGPRQGQLILTESSTDSQATTRANAGSVTRADVRQTGSNLLAEAAMIISANKGAGYSYMPNANYCMGTNMELFNMGRLEALQKENNVDLVVDDIYPSTVQEYITSDTEEDLQDKLAISASLSVDFKTVAVKVSGHYENTNTSDKSCKYAMARLKSYYFTREVNYMNIAALAESSTTLRDQLYAPGFRKYLDDFIAKVKQYENDIEKTKAICNEFLSVVGPCFISKAVMGCTADYEMSIKADSLNDALSLGGALEVALMINGVKVSVEGKGDYEKKEMTVNNSSNIKVCVRGGEVGLINILATGGKIETKQFVEWQQSVKPENCVMVDMSLTPIYAIIFDQKAHDVLKAYFDSIIESSK